MNKEMYYRYCFRKTLFVVVKVPNWQRLTFLLFTPNSRERPSLPEFSFDYSSKICSCLETTVTMLPPWHFMFALYPFE
ncbi:RNA binding motif protein 26 [Phyllostomus discolor]|uniref:RNA binding motif protein 26 n=1 Tax=Phyllostomus discolor TaxID=89673 RepID=A0A833YYY9_9CHIR|nr:RNA binding motif protein 26 [Phyllostomus discolor]